MRSVGRSGSANVARPSDDGWPSKKSLTRLSRFRTYVGLPRSRGRLAALLKEHGFERAVDAAEMLGSCSPLAEVSLPW